MATGDDEEPLREAAKISVSSHRAQAKFFWFRPADPGPAKEFKAAFKYSPSRLQRSPLPLSQRVSQSKSRTRNCAIIQLDGSKVFSTVHALPLAHPSRELCMALRNKKLRSRSVAGILSSLNPGLEEEEDEILHAGATQAWLGLRRAVRETVARERVAGTLHVRIKRPCLAGQERRGRMAPEVSVESKTIMFQNERIKELILDAKLRHDVDTGSRSRMVFVRYRSQKLLTMNRRVSHSVSRNVRPDVGPGTQRSNERSDRVREAIRRLLQDKAPVFSTVCLRRCKNSNTDRKVFMHDEYAVRLLVLYYHGAEEPQVDHLDGGRLMNRLQRIDMAS